MQKRQGRYYRFSEYLRERFGCAVYKVSVDGGFSCPNRDGALSREGCVYCDNRAFSVNARLMPKPLEIQIEEGRDFGRRRYGAQAFFVYFQAHTNTYAPVGELKERYDTVKKFKDIVGISIGTRPDYVNDPVLDLIEGYTGSYEVWLEYGLQSVHDETLRLINRNHSYDDFLRAVALTRKRRLKICAHVIIGLPGETREHIAQTAKELGRLRLDGVKIHPLHIVRGTALEKLLEAKSYRPLELDEYIELAAEFLSHLRPDTVIQRVSADCPADLLVAPKWILDKREVLERIDRKLAREDIFQGKNLI